MRSGIPWLVRCAIFVCLLLPGILPVYGADDPGLTVPVSAPEGVDVLARADLGLLNAMAVADQDLIRNRVVEKDVARSVVIHDAFQENRGILNVNQESGNLNTQANVRVLAFGEAGSLIQNLHVEISTRRIDNTLISSGGEREDRITHSFGGTLGIVGVNQSSGNLNQQANVLVLGVGVVLGPESVALGDATLGAISADNSLKQDDAAGRRTEVITDSFAGFRGIAQVSQSAGDHNTMGNTVGLSFTAVNVR